MLLPGKKNKLAPKPAIDNAYRIFEMIGILRQDWFKSLCSDLSRSTWETGASVSYPSVEEEDVANEASTGSLCGESSKYLAATNKATVYIAHSPNPTTHCCAEPHAINEIKPKFTRMAPSQPKVSVIDLHMVTLTIRNDIFCFYRCNGLLL